MNSFELDERIDKDLKQYIIDRENKRQDLNYKKLMQGIKMSKEDGIVMRDFFNTVYPLSFKSIFKLFIKRFSLKKAC